MPKDPLASLELISALVQGLFAFLFGSCIGSLVNVLAYRMPLGLSVIHPPSRCPACHTRLTWRENIPIFGWLRLRGRCRFCRSPISPEYPLVEALVASLFLLVYFLWYLLPPHGMWPAHQPAVWLGFDWGTVKPDWAIGGFTGSWPLYVMTVVMIGCLVAMTICDARTFMIPLALAWVPAGVALVAHTGWAAYLDATKVTKSGVVGPTLVRLEQGWTWAIPSPGAWGGNGWWMVGASIGGVLGLGVANLLVSKGLIRRSFADYPAWEESVVPKPKPWPNPFANACPLPETQQAEEVTPSAEPAAAPPETPAKAAGDGSPADLWLEYPHARREMFKELCFLSPVVTLAVVGGWLTMHFWGGHAGHASPATPVAVLAAAHPIPLWLDAMTGSLFGMLMGGGVVWLVRLLGTLGFGREALGLGDVHLMAGVGACMGFIDASLAFLLSAFVGLVITGVQAVVRGKAARALPLGPSLAVATLLVLLGKVWIEKGLGLIAPALAPVHLP
jgi:leader peptidase (prepilin peptidase)/N-methyltransferase